MDAQDHDRRLALLRWLLAAGITSTALHYTHNFVEIDQYPDGLVSGKVIQVAILAAWPLLTAVGLIGYRLYAENRLQAAHGFLVAYSFTGLSTLGHFLYGTPDIPAFFFATIFTDALTGAAVLAFALWSMAQERGRTRRATSATAA